VLYRVQAKEVAEMNVNVIEVGSTRQKECDEPGCQSTVQTITRVQLDGKGEALAWTWECSEGHTQGLVRP
jgi:hypothetical protein